MIISHKHKLIFIHIPKNAGSSIHNAMRPIACSWLMTRIAKRMRNIFNIEVPWHPMPLSPHANAIKIRNHIGSKKFNAYHKFAVIREPIERAYSLYTYPLRNTYVKDHSIIKSMSGFDEFCEFMCSRGTKTQRSYVVDENNNLLTNQLISLNNIQAELESLSKCLNIQIQLDHRNKSRTEEKLPHINAATSKLIYEYFTEDFELYNAVKK